MWREADQQTRLYYEAKGQEELALYEQKVALFEATYGKIEIFREAKEERERRLEVFSK